MAPRIPDELFRGILDHIDDTPTILSLLVVSRFLNAEAERMLYHTVTVFTFIATSDLFVQRLIDCERIARLVRRLSVSDGNTQKARSTWERLFSSALLGVVNLEYLACDTLFLPLPDIAYTFRLTEFRWGGLLDSGQFLNFVSQQSCLRALVVTGHTVLGPPPLSICPNLSTLAGPTALLRSFLPSHKIRCLRWFVTEFENVEFALPDIEEPLHHLRSLSLFGSSEPLSFAALVPHLMDLEYLELMGNWKNYTVLTQMPRLRGVTLVGGFDMSDDTARGLVSGFFTELCELHFIEMRHSSGDLLRWERGGSEPRAVEMKHSWTATIG